jgi:aerobic-type carbon monoxide dehydrogenase small subunit (CoxS/CutS family)
MSKDKKKKPREVTRRQFLAGTGIVVGGAAIGSAALLAACGGEAETETVTQTQTATQTVTTTQQVGTATVTTTAPGPTTTQTLTETISEYVCPFDNQAFSTVSALAIHMEVEHPSEELTRLTINGEIHELKIEPHWTLLRVLRDVVGLTGTKKSCGKGECGVCTVIMDSRPVYACLLLAATCESKNIETIEALADSVTKELHPIQQAFKDLHGMQCGFCTPGFIMAAKALLDSNPSPTVDEIKEGLSGVLCRCGNYTPIINSVLAAV